jgi:hypothetical protein
MVKALSIAGLLAFGGSAHAWVEGPHGVPDYSAHTMADGEIRLSLFRSGYAFTDWLQVETLPLLWAVRVTNFDFKASYPVSDTWTLSANLGLLAWNLANMPGASKDAADVRLNGLPVQARSTWVLGDWGLTAGLAYTGIKVSGDADADAADLDATAAISTSQLTGAAEWRTSRSFALVLEGRLMIWEDLRADAVTTTDIDDDTVLVLHGDTQVDLQQPVRGNATLSAMWSYETFNLRLGLGYGHYSLPVFSTFLTQATVVPEFAMYWRF